MKQFTSALLFATCTATTSQAAIVIGNLSSFTNDNGTASAVVGTGSGKAIGFTMGADSYTIDSVLLRLRDVGNNLSTDLPLITIWTSNGTSPVAQVGDILTNPVSFTPASAVNYTFTTAATITLEANQSYFLVVRGNNSATNFNWLNGSPTVAPTGIASSAIGRFGTAQPVPNWTSSSSNFNWFQINGTVVSAIPEPSSFALFAGAAGLGLVATRRRSRR